VVGVGRRISSVVISYLQRGSSDSLAVRHGPGITVQAFNMDPATKSVDDLRRRIRKVEAELEDLKEQLAAAERETEHGNGSQKPWKWPLKADEYERYARQLVLPSIGIRGQKTEHCCNMHGCYEG